MRSVAQWDKILEDEDVLEDRKMPESVSEIAENVRRLATRVVPRAIPTIAKSHFGCKTPCSSTVKSTVSDSKCIPDEN